MITVPACTNWIHIMVHIKAATVKYYAPRQLAFHTFIIYLIFQLESNNFSLV